MVAEKLLRLIDERKMRKEKATFFALVASVLLVLSYLFVSEEGLETVGKKRRISRLLSSVVGYGKDLIPQVTRVNCSVTPLVNKSNDTLWQYCQSSAVYLYSAFFDDRYSYQGVSYTKIRVIGMSEGKARQDLYCLLWEKNTSYSVYAEHTEIWMEKWDDSPDNKYRRPYIFSCPLPNKVGNIELVSIVSQPCEQPTVYIPLTHPEKGAKKDFVICVKTMNYDSDISLRLVEWIELQLLLGADVIFVYLYSVHPNVKKALSYYQDRGVVKLKYFSPPGRSHEETTSQEGIWQKRRNELIPYNDCFYRHIYTHHFAVLLDLDEIIIPTLHYTWQQMMSSILEEIPDALEIYSSFSAQNVYFFDELGRDSNATIPAYMHILKYVFRSANFSKPGYAVKSFCSTNNTLAVFNHYSLIPLHPKLRRNGLISRRTAQLHHYRSQCPPLMEMECEKNFMRYRRKDTLAWKYAPELIKNVRLTLGKLELGGF